MSKLTVKLITILFLTGFSLALSAQSVPFAFWRAPADGGPLASLEYITHTTGGSPSYPGGIKAGDLLVFYNYAIYYDSISSSVPSGFTTAVNTANDNGFDTGYIRAIVSYKIANGSESGNLSGGLSGLYNFGMLILFRPNTGINSASVHSVVRSETTGNPSSRSITSGSGTPLLMAMAVYSSANIISSDSFSPAGDQRISTGSGVLVARWKIYNTGVSPSNHTIDMSDSGDLNAMGGFYIQLE